MNISTNEGFTLVEVLVAITIFAVGLLAVAGMQLTALQANATSVEITSASALAQGSLQEILSKSSDTPMLEDAVTDALWSTKTLPGSGTYEIYYTVSPGTPSPGVSQITVRAQRGNRSVTVIGYKKTSS